jgi:hypothetical protein
MAHNFVLLLIPPDVEKHHLANYTQELLLPFGSEYDFPPLTYPCECNGLKESTRFANTSTKHFHHYWRSYKMISPELRPEWNEYIMNWENALLSFSKNINTTDPRCDQCNGSGYFTSTHYPWNMYDYWHGLQAEDLGNIAELRAELKTHELTKGKQLGIFRLIPPLQKPFMFYHVVTSDGLPYNRWEYSSEEKWYATWQVLAKQWENSRVVRCLVHQ